jgi:hypothetical protein
VQQKAKSHREDAKTKAASDFINKLLDEKFGILDKNYPDEQSIIERNYFRYRESEIQERNQDNE